MASFNTLIVEQAAQRGEQTFVFDTTTSLTSADFRDKALRVAVGLERQVVRRGDRVAVQLPNRQGGDREHHPEASPAKRRGSRRIESAEALQEERLPALGELSPPARGRGAPGIDRGAHLPLAEAHQVPVADREPDVVLEHAGTDAETLS